MLMLDLTAMLPERYMMPSFEQRGVIARCPDAAAYEFCQPVYGASRLLLLARAASAAIMPLPRVAAEVALLLRRPPL